MKSATFYSQHRNCGKLSILLDDETKTVSGNTYPIRDIMRNMGKYNPETKSWELSTPRYAQFIDLFCSGVI